MFTDTEHICFMCFIVWKSNTAHCERSVWVLQRQRFKEMIMLWDFVIWL